MNIQEVRVVAKRNGISPARLGKADLIRAIQIAEGNFPCFGSAVSGACDQAECAWRQDCLPTKRKKGAE